MTLDTQKQVFNLKINNMKKLLFLLIFAPLFSIAQIPTPLPNTYVNDLAGKLNSKNLSTLNDSIHAIETRTSVQIAVLLIPQLPDGMSVEDYTLEVGRKWHVGNAHNGIVFVASLKEHKMRLEIADNLQGTITDAEASHITGQLKYFCKAEDYNGAIQTLIQNIKERIDPITKNQMALAAAELDKKHDKQWEAFKIFMLWFGVIGLGFLSFFIPYFNKKKTERLAREAEEEKERTNSDYHYLDIPVMTMAALAAMPNLSGMRKFKNKGRYNQNVPTPILPPTPIDDDIPSYTSKRSDDSNSNNRSTNDYGNWGSGNSDSSSSNDSGFSGGGSTDSW